MRLLLVGDDEALDVLAELSRHLDYFEVSRQDELPERALDERDHLIIGLTNGRGQALLDAARIAGNPGFATLLTDERTPGARAIVAAADLLRARHELSAPE